MGRLDRVASMDVAPPYRAEAANGSPRLRARVQQAFRSACHDPLTWYGVRILARALVSSSFAIVFAALIASPSAWADRRCAVPLADWQPRQALESRLAADGWTVLSIRTDDGCYKVSAKNARGEVMKAKFDPATLERVTGDRHGHGGRDDDRGDDDH